MSAFYFDSSKMLCQKRMCIIYIILLCIHSTIITVDSLYYTLHTYIVFV